MAKGYELHQGRMMALQAMGKDLTRRAKSRCEITGVSGVPLRSYEVPPVAETPDFDRTLLVSDACMEVLQHPKRLAGREWQCLTEAVWSDMPAVQVVAWRMLRELATREDWAREALDEVFLDPEIEEWANAELL
jgi:protein PhnA